MPDPGLPAWLLAGILAVGGVATSPFERWAYRSGAGAARKFLAYGVTILYLWVLMAVAVRLYGWERLLISPGPAAAALPAPGIVASALAAIPAFFFVLALLPLVQSLRGLRWRRAYAAAIRSDFARIPGIVPNDAAERWAWIALSLTAGICEEILFRGFLIRLLHEGALALPLAGALALSSLGFGLAHFYQGRKGVVNTTVAGFAFGILFLLSGSLIPCIVVHALIDLQMAYVMRPLPDEDGPAAAGAA